MNYTIQSGDNLWNIVRNKYNCQNNGEINETVKQIIATNDIGDGNLIFSGQEISLPDNEFLIHDKPQEFKDWLEDADAIEDFEMFDYDLRSQDFEGYADDIEEFSKELINQYDKNGDGELDINEYAQFHHDVKGKESTTKTGFDSFNIEGKTDKNDNTISAQEFAANLINADSKAVFKGYDCAYFEKDGKLNKATLAKLVNNPSGYNNEAAENFFNRNFKANNN